MPTEEGWMKTATSILALLVSTVALVLSISNYKFQRRVADRVWRSQLITVIYESEGCKAISPCPPKANLRSRQDAVKAFILLQRDYGVKIDLRRVFLSEMELRKVVLSKSDLSRATLLSTHLEEADLSNSLFVNAILTKASLYKVNCDRCNFTFANLQGVVLREACLEGAALIKADLTEATLSKANCKNTDFTFANLQGVNLSDANLEGARLINAILGVCGEQQFDAATGVRISSADLRRAKLVGADLQGASLCGVNLRDADLSGVKHLTQGQINQAEGNQQTVLPDFLSRPKSWDNRH